MGKKLYINTVQKCCNYLFAKTQEPVEYVISFSYSTGSCVLAKML